MGGCSSCEAAAVVEATAKVVLPDGGLREHSMPVTAASVLGKDAAGFFVCDADELEIDGLVSAMTSDEELSMGQIYFLLPRKMLKHPLQAEELAKLAVRASSALMGVRRRCGRATVAPLGFPSETGAEQAEAGARKREEEKRRRSRKGCAGRGRKFTPDLVAIPE